MIGGGGNVITGGIDLSLAANLGLSAAIYATLIKTGYGDALALAATLGAGAAVGAAQRARRDRVRRRAAAGDARRRRRSSADSNWSSPRTRW